MRDDKYLFKIIDGETFHVVDQDGTYDKRLDPGLPESTLLKMYRLMVESRIYDDKALKMQRSGRMGTYPPLSGQEAAQIGSALALEEGDWLVPSYRDGGAMLARGVSLKTQFMAWMGNDLGYRIPDGLKVTPISIPVGSQILHATGIAWASKLKGEKSSVIVYFGDGATSRGDFHEGLNFGGVFKVPAVYFCSNNGFAISTRQPQQTAAATIAQKAVAYGIRGYRLDGMDAVAAYVLTKHALELARKGEGPVLIEALCYRYGPHTTSDNPDLYRDKEEVAKIIKETDPCERLKNYLVKKGIWDEGREKSLREELAGIVDKEAKEAEETPPPTLESLLENVYGRR